MDFYYFLVYSLVYVGLFATSFYIINLIFYYRYNKDPAPSTDKKVSIIIPAFNEEKSIAKTIETALASHYVKENLEIIVVDDGSRDKTYEIASKYISSKHPRVKVFSKENGGKGSALNYGLAKCKGEIVISMDADTFVEPDAIQKMVGFFRNKRVMSVSPSMGIYKPKGLWARVLQVEYYMGVFLRKSFATMNAIHVTPGAFSAYRKSFFDKHGGYDVGNLTEDLEVALRIQSHHYIIENAQKASVHTVSPDTFRGLLVQRRRWYAGLVKNLWNYRRIFGFKHGALGAVVLPVAVSTIILSVILTIYMVVRALIEIKTELFALSSINFKFNNFFEMGSYMSRKLFFHLASNPLFIILILFTALLVFYLIYSKKQMLHNEGLMINLVLFMGLYSLLFAFWWTISFVYVLFNREVRWRD